ncbi:hypothetical protein GQ53DRAFT_887077 [Thozetella sp. PMI_491]|nr:hypothetical protein GQ53DRAFT_887077 [Thozetella sp. PMI_491]
MPPHGTSSSTGHEGLASHTSGGSIYDRYGGGNTADRGVASSNWRRGAAPLSSSSGGDRNGTLIPIYSARGHHGPIQASSPTEAPGYQGIRSYDGALTSSAEPISTTTGDMERGRVADPATRAALLNLLHNASSESNDDIHSHGNQFGPGHHTTSTTSGGSGSSVALVNASSPDTPAHIQNLALGGAHFGVSNVPRQPAICGPSLPLSTFVGESSFVYPPGCDTSSNQAGNAYIPTGLYSNMGINTNAIGVNGPVTYAYCIQRPNGSIVPLVPVDMLPPLRDIPATVPSPRNLTILPVPPGLAPNGRSYYLNSIEVIGLDAFGVNDPIQNHIDTVVARAVPGPLSRRPKIYCDKWVHDGTCAFTQQGCKFKHEMPFDRRTQHDLGLFHGLPTWWKKQQAELQRQGQLQITDDQPIDLTIQDSAIVRHNTSAAGTTRYSGSDFFTQTESRVNISSGAGNTGAIGGIPATPARPITSISSFSRNSAVEGQNSPARFGAIGTRRAIRQPEQDTSETPTRASSVAPRNLNLANNNRFAALEFDEAAIKEAEEGYCRGE